MEEATPVGTKRKAEWFDIDEEKNTYVYVSNLPTSLTEEDFIDLMKKYGIIAKKPKPPNPFNIKLYKDETGSFKGDALCCFVRVESVDLAITHLDGYLFNGTHTLKCERAKFQMKGSYDPTKKPRPLDKKAKLKQKKTIDRLLSWEPKAKPETKQTKVILEHMFAPAEILEDATLILDLKEDVELKCSEIQCEPKRIDIYDKHPEGVIAVSFAEASQAERCISALNDQLYAGRQVKAKLWDGKTNYKTKETDEETEKRLEKWHEDLQKSDDEGEEDNKSASKTVESGDEKDPVASDSKELNE